MQKIKPSQSKKKNNDNKRYFPLRDPENPFKVTLTPITEEQYQKKIDDAAKLGEGQNSASKVIDAMTSKK